MKIAVIITGRVEAYQSFNLEMLQGCDIFIHTDSNYHTKALEYNPKDIILTNSSFSLNTVENFYDGNVLILAQQLLEKAEVKNTKHFSANFTRIIQWRRLYEVFEKVDFTEYDFIIRWRDDLLKFEPDYPNTPSRFLNQISNEYGNFKNYVSCNSFKKENVYIYKDLLFLFHPSNIEAVNVYKGIKKYICKKEEDTWFDANLLNMCDNEGKYCCGRFEWLNSEDKPFTHGFTSETALLLNCLVRNVPLKNIFRMLF